MPGEISPTSQRLATVERLLHEKTSSDIASVFAPLRGPLMDLRKALEQEQDQLVEKLQSELTAAATEVAQALGLSEHDAGHYRGEVVNAIWREPDNREPYANLGSSSRSDVRKLESALDDQRDLLQWIKEAKMRLADGDA